MKLRPDAPLLVVQHHDYEDIIRTLGAKGLGRRVIHCTNVAEAKRYLFDTPDAAMPAMVLLDLSCPEHNGTELLAALKGDQDLRVTPVVVFGPKGDRDGELARCYEMGANACMQKAEDSDAYRDALATLASYWLKTAVLPITALSV